MEGRGDMSIVSLISEERVKVPLESTTKREVIKELIDILLASGDITEAELAFMDVMEREAKGSTGLEFGVAIPHAKTSTVKTLTMAIGIARNGIDFDSIDGRPARLFFLLLAPPDQSGPHIEALSEIARLMQSESFIRELLDAPDSAAVVRLFREE